MLDAVIAWSLSRRFAVLGGALLVCLAGWVAVRGLVIDAFPDTTPVQVQINTVAPGMVAEEVERQITFPVELAMGGMPGLEDIRSASMFGLSVVIVTFRDGTNVYFARQLINERLGTVEVPPGAARPEMGPVSTGLAEVFHYLLVPRGMSLTEVKTLQEWTLKPELRAVPGTAEVNAWGGLNKQYQIRVDPSLLRRYDLSFDQVVEAVPRNNFNVGGGSIDRSGDAVLVYGVGRTIDVEQIGRIVIASRDGVPIRIRDVAAVAHVWSRVGTPEVATEAGALEGTDMFIALHPREGWKRARTQAGLVEEMSRIVEGIPGQIVWFTQPIEQRINEMVSGVRADIAVKVFGSNLEQLVAKANEVAAVIRDVPGGADVAVEQVAGQPILKVAVRQEEIARYGISAKDVLDVVESVGGKAVGQIVEGQFRFPIVVRLPESRRAGPEALAGIPLRSPAGENVPLGRIADEESIQGPKYMTREWSQRRVVVQCNVRGRDVGGFVAEAQKAIAERVDLPAGQFRVVWGGQFENMQRAQKRLAIVVPLALVLILVLLYLTYRNVADTGLLFVSVPFACVGGIWALAARGMPLSISAAVGFITLSGVSVLNGMVLASVLRERLARGTARDVAIEETAAGALRTIVMTALVASLGFIPMAVSEGTGAEVQRPLATVVIGGVVTSTLFTLFVLPALYRLVLRVSPAPGVPKAWAAGD